MILDGWGIPEDKNASAIHHARTPFIDSLYDNYPNATLLTHGLHVGLPEGQMGNSEVGHMNLGAGRIVYQDLAKINLAIKNNTLKDEANLVATLDYAKKNNKAIHFLGLVSDGGVHSHIDHIKALTSISQDYGIENSYIHAFTDGRDVDPKSGLEHIKHLQKHIAETNTKLATVTGRYYAMDRDQRWERIQKAYKALVCGKGVLCEDAIKTIADCYEEGITDEFIPPIILSENNKPVATIEEGDAIIFFNFRTDRGRQLTSALSQEDFPVFGMKKLKTYFTTLTNYDDTFKDIQVIFDKENINDTLGEVLANNNKRQIRIAETEKYPHVTFFFNGGREALFEGENRILCDSPKVATYDLKPTMSSGCIAESIVAEIKKRNSRFYLP
jgi:2,3-bisphosphoglycerate-independent phosphoglycerate mutase